MRRTFVILSILIVIITLIGCKLTNNNDLNKPKINYWEKEVKKIVDAKYVNVTDGKKIATVYVGCRLDQISDCTTLVKKYSLQKKNMTSHSFQIDLEYKNIDKFLEDNSIEYIDIPTVRMMADDEK